MKKFLEILKNSTLKTTMSNEEIQNLYYELDSSVEEYIENRIEDDLDDKQDEIDDLEYEIKEYKKEIEELEDNQINSIFPSKTIDDIMTIEWVSSNWEHLIKMQKENVQFDRNKKKHKRIILVGHGASGKDTARKRFEEQGFKYAISYTTRPPRVTEKEGVDYFFLSESQFDNMAKNNEFYEYVSFNGWKYGTTNEQFYKDDIFIMTPYGISKLKPEDRKESLIVFFNVCEEERKKRLALRSDADTVDRRLEADKKDFNNFKDFDISITNSDF